MSIDDILGYNKPIIYLIPAYGRSYNSKESMLKDWEAGKDFKILNGPYCSIRDSQSLKRMGTVVLKDLWDGNISITIQ